MNLKKQLNQIIQNNSNEIMKYYAYVLFFDAPVSNNIDLSYVWRGLLNNHQSILGYANRYYWKNKIDGGGIRIIGQNDNQQYIRAILFSSISNLHSSGFVRQLNIRWRKLIGKKLYPTLKTGTYFNGLNYSIVQPNSNIEEYIQMIDQNIINSIEGNLTAKIQSFGRFHELLNSSKKHTI